MAPRNKDNAPTLAPDAPARTDYARDVYTWSQEQARAIREGRFEDIDRENVAEEIESVGRTEFNSLISALRVLMRHMLKWDHQPEQRSRSWENTIKEQRNRVHRQFRKNPSLKSQRDEVVRDGYASGRLLASTEADMDVDRFPEECPYDWDAIVGREFKR